MKSFVLCLSLALTAFSLSCGYSASSQSNSGAFFSQAGADTDSQVQSLRQQLNYVQSNLGIQAFDFDFSVPAGKKLVATFVAELNGKVVPDMSGVFHIPSTDVAPAKKGGISVYFFEPQYVSSNKLSPTWQLEFRIPQFSYVYAMPSPYTPSGSNMRTGSANSSNISPLEEGKDYDVWTREIKESDRSEHPLYEFKYTLKVRLEKLAEGDSVDKITRVPLPASE